MSPKNAKAEPLGPNDCLPGGPNGWCKPHGYPFYHCAAVVARIREGGPEGHTACWPDGLTVTRLCSIRNHIYLQITWRGTTHKLRLGQRVAEVVR